MKHSVWSLALINAFFLLALDEFTASARAQQYSVTVLPSAINETGVPVGNAINANGTVTGFTGPPSAGFNPASGNASAGGLIYIQPSPGSTLFQYGGGTTTDLGGGRAEFSTYCNAAEPIPEGIGINAGGVITGAICATQETAPTAFTYSGGFTLLPPSWGRYCPRWSYLALKLGAGN